MHCELTNKCITPRSVQQRETEHLSPNPLLIIGLMKSPVPC